ncbi:MAG: alpha/beta fold hydrolase [Planctomycetota bacterium]
MKTVYRSKSETGLIVRANPSWTPTNGEPRQVETTYSYPIEIALAEMEEVDVAEIRPGSYRRLYAAPNRLPLGLDHSDPNVAAELQRIVYLKKADRERFRTIYYATNRKVADAGAVGVSRFGNDIGPRISYGSALVRIPPTHRYGDEIDTPFVGWLDDPEKHFRVTALNRFDESAFYAAMRTTLSQPDDLESLTRNDVLLFVHGFRTTMEFALLRPAQIGYDIGFEGKTCAFSWPSRGKFLAYGEDQRQASASVLALSMVLRKLIEQQTDGRVHIVAHSMGNFLAMQALEQLADEFEDLAEIDRPKLGHVILADPDVGESDFELWTPRVVEVAKTVTLYHCSKDWALTGSFLLNSGQSRAGLRAWSLSGLDNVDCDDVSTEWLGHSAYADDSPLLFDIQLLLQRDARPEVRPLRRLEDLEPGHPYWQAIPEVAEVIEGF